MENAGWEMLVCVSVQCRNRTESQTHGTTQLFSGWALSQLDASRNPDGQHLNPLNINNLTTSQISEIEVDRSVQLPGNTNNFDLENRPPRG